MQKFFFSLSIIVLPLLSHAQFGYAKVSDIEALQSRKLIVITEVPNSKVLKKLRKKDQEDKINMYENAIAGYNDNMKRVVEKFWIFSKNGIEYETYKQADSLRKTGNKDYAVLYCVSGSMSDFHSGFDEDDGLDWTWDIKDDSKDRDYFDGFTEMKVSTLEDLHNKPIMYAVLTDIFPTVVSLVNGVNTLQTYVDVRLRSKRDKEDISGKSLMNEWVAKNNKDLKKKTLLIREDFLDKGYDKNKVAENYPYKFQIVSSSKLDSVVYNQDSNYVYALIVPGINGGESINQVYYAQAIYSTVNPEMYAYVMPSIGAAIFKTEFGAHKIGHKYIDSKVLQDFTNQGN